MRDEPQTRAGSTPFQGDDSPSSGPSRERLDGPASLSAMQAEVAEWHRREFPVVRAEWLAMIVSEEAGEVTRAVLKLAQGIRTETDWRAEIEKESADVLGGLLALADRFGFSLEAAWVDRFRGTVTHRQFASIGQIPGQESLL